MKPPIRAAFFMGTTTQWRGHLARECRSRPGRVRCFLSLRQQISRMGQRGSRCILAGHHLSQFPHAVFAFQHTDFGDRLAVLGAADGLLGNLKMMVSAGSDLREVGDADNLVPAAIAVGLHSLSRR